MTSTAPAIVWFRQDLRLADNPALSAAVDTGKPILPVFILDDDSAGEWQMGAASRWWLHQSLESLNTALRGQLRLYCGDAQEILQQLARETGAGHVFWNRCYEPWRIARDKRLMHELREAGLSVSSYNGSMLFEPHTITKSDGTPYKVFTPYYHKGCLSEEHAPQPPLHKPKQMELAKHAAGVTLAELELMPSMRWYEEIAQQWQPGEDGAWQRLQAFLENGIRGYKQGRNRPDQNHCSRLSPHLHFGEISPRQVWQETEALANQSGIADDVDHFRSELAWREFSYYLLYHCPQLPEDNLQAKFDRFPWREDNAALACWQRGATGVPIVDAGMRQLWRTGYMHNRVRMVVASFLIKNLMLHWHHGQMWFWDTLVDADLANNSAGWQWVAGTGADAAPYFRIFNPVLQGKKFDPDGDYVRRYVPEIAELPNRYLHSPWTAPDAVLAKANITLGKNYPEPIVDLKESRERALAAFKDLGTAA